MWKLDCCRLSQQRITRFESEITLTNQEQGKEWEYRILAVNKASEGKPSNTVM
jgi:hypothetical protein